MIVRERELSVLVGMHGESPRGIGGVVVIEGDAGIGKTTLVNRTAVQRAGTKIVLACPATAPTRPAYLAGPFFWI